MVAFSYSVPDFRVSIPAGTKTTTIRMYTSDKQYERICRSELYYHYWKMRTPVCELIDHSVPRGRVRLIEHVLDWIENRATQQDILNDGFTDRHTMGLFFLDRYRISDLQGTWMIPKWYPCIGVIS